MFTCMHKCNTKETNTNIHACAIHACKNTCIIIRIVRQGMHTMVKSVRINDEEQEKLRKKAVELNKVLIQKGQQPLRDSELVHILIAEGLDQLEVGNSGQVKIIK